jgi:hypothetical protein
LRCYPDIGQSACALFLYSGIQLTTENLMKVGDGLYNTEQRPRSKFKDSRSLDGVMYL